MLMVESDLEKKTIVLVGIILSAIFSPLSLVNFVYYFIAIKLWKGVKPN
jgi:hypothetical protein